MYYFDNIKAALEDKDRIVTHIGGEYYVVKEKHEQYITLGKFPGPPEEYPPTFESITLTGEEFDTLNCLYKEMTEAVPELLTTTPCFLSPDHQAQFGFLLCHECNPFKDIHDF